MHDDDHAATREYLKILARNPDFSSAREAIGEEVASVQNSNNFSL